MIKLSEDTVLLHLLTQYENYGQRALCMPRFTPSDWWECDLASVTPANYLTEYEVKLSRSDFFADFNKCTSARSQRRGRPELRKHDLIPQGKGPKFFWFVMPIDLVELSDIPDYAGVIYIQKQRPNDKRLVLRIARHAPRLPAKKLRGIDIERLKQSAYYRFLNQFVKNQRSVIANSVSADIIPEAGDD